MKAAATQHKGRWEYHKHGDSYRQRLLKQRGVAAIDGRTPEGKRAKEWLALALEKKGGKAIPADSRETTEGAMFYLWRSLELRSHTVSRCRIICR